MMADNRQNVNPMAMTRAAEERSVYMTLLIFTLLIVTVPVASYFIFKHMILEGIFLMSSRKSYVYAAGIAVVTVHVIVGAFIYVAWNEGDKIYPPTFKED